MVTDKRDAILADVARNYSLRPLSMSRVYAGCGTRNWSLRTSEGRFFVKEYCRAHRVSVHDIGFAPHVWLVQLIRSMYGVKQHYTRPVELQESLDRFWVQRAHAARTLFANLATVQETLKSVWETSSSDGRTR